MADNPAGALYRLVQTRPLPTIDDIDRHLRGRDRDDQFSQLSYQHPRTKYNVLMYMAINDDNPLDTVGHMIDMYLCDYSPDECLEIIGARERGVGDNLLQRVISPLDEKTSFVLVDRLLRLLSPQGKVDCIFRGNYDDESLFYMAIEKDNAIRLVCKHLPLHHECYSDLSSTTAGCEGPQGTSVSKQLAPLIMYTSIQCEAPKVFKYSVMICQPQARLYLQTLPQVYMASGVSNEFLLTVFDHESYDIINSQRLQHTHILEHALRNCKFKFVQKMIERNEGQLLLTLSTRQKTHLLYTICLTLISYTENCLSNNPGMIDEAMIIFNAIVISSAHISLKQVHEYLTSLENSERMSVMYTVTIFQCKEALRLVIRHTRLWEDQLSTKEFLKFLIRVDQRDALAEIIEATENMEYYLYKIGQVIREEFCSSIHEYLYIPMTVEMLGTLSKLVTAQYIIPYTSQQQGKCVRSAIVYYDQEFVDTAEELRVALEIVCGNRLVEKEPLNYEGFTARQAETKFKQTFVKFLTDYMDISSLLIVSLISHGHAGNIYLGHDVNDTRRCSPLKIKTILELIRGQKSRFRRDDEPPLPTVIIISACQDLEGYDQNDWDELLSEGSIQLMLNDTEMLVAAKPGLPSWTGGYIKSLTEILANIDYDNKKSLKELHENAVEELMKNPEYHQKDRDERQIPLLMSTATKSIILTPNRYNDDSVYYDDTQ